MVAIETFGCSIQGKDSMSYDQARLEDLATRYTEAWNSKDPKRVSAFHLPSSRISINRGEPSVGHDGLTAMAAGFHADVPDLCLRNDGIRSAGNHVVYMWTFTGHDAQTGTRWRSAAGRSGISTRI
jgi:hypothetical protein